MSQGKLHDEPESAKNALERAKNASERAKNASERAKNEKWTQK
jgi:hypothetical protein